MQSRLRWMTLAGLALACSGLGACTDEGFTVCGDGIVNGEEECDDANFVVGDGCSGGCEVEEGWECFPDTGSCGALCGDGLVVGIEGCDDGNLANGDGCSDQCRVESCGDGVLQPEHGEVCDDGNQQHGDGCSAGCLSDETCGNGYQDLLLGEYCDEGPANSDAPDAHCRLDCTLQRCGDGILDLGAEEQCDDGNLVDGDGCDLDCQHTPVLVLAGTLPYFAVDGSHVYWSDGVDVQRIPLLGGPASPVASGVGLFVIDDTHLYGVSSSPAGDASLVKVPLAGGAPITLATSLPPVQDLALNTTHLLWSSTDASAVSAIFTTGGAVVELVSGQIQPFKIVADDDHAYWLDRFGGTIERCPVAGGATEELVSGLSLTRSIALGADHVYWGDNGSLYRRGKQGGTTIELAFLDNAVTAIAVGTTEVYALTERPFMGGNYSLYSVPNSGGTPVLLAGEHRWPGDLALGSSHIYWSTCAGLSHCFAVDELMAIPW